MPAYSSLRTNADQQKRSLITIFLALFLLVSSALFWSLSSADQAAVDAGVNFAKGLQNNVQQLSTNTQIESVPGYGGTNLPQTDYYRQQNLSGMQTDAVVDLTTGTANEAAQYGYAKATQPRLQFAEDDPLLLNAEGISAAAIQSPDVLTVPTGNCRTETVHGIETRTEHCTAWVTPTQHVCNNTLQVNVSWDEVSSCPIGTSFNQASTVHNYRGADDITFARAYCNPGSGENFVDLQVDASDGDPADCSSWTGITVSTNITSETSTGAVLRPRFGTSGCTQVFVSAEGACVDSNCHYALNFYEFSHWSYNDNGAECSSGLIMNLSAVGFTGVPSGDPSWGVGNLHCVYKKSTVTLDFEKPHITKIPNVSENWVNGCGFLEAQVQ